MRQVTVAKWGEEVGISRQAAYRAAERCGIPIADGKVDAEAATVLYRSRTRSRANQRTPGAQNDANLQTESEDSAQGYWASRARREHAEADLAELKLKQQIGELVLASEVRSSYARRAAALRESLMQISARLAPLVTAETDQAKNQAAIDAEIRGVLEQLSD